MKYTKIKLDLISEKLKNMPAVKDNNQGCSKQEAVKLLKKEISSMQQRGYSLDQISEVLRTEGIDITTGTLKSYLQRAKIIDPEILIRAPKIPFINNEKELINTKNSGTANTSDNNDINDI